MITYTQNINQWQGCGLELLAMIPYNIYIMYNQIPWGQNQGIRMLTRYIPQWSFSIVVMFLNGFVALQCSLSVMHIVIFWNGFVALNIPSCLCHNVTFILENIMSNFYVPFLIKFYIVLWKSSMVMSH